MKKLKVMMVFGTRPEAIKMAPLVKELEQADWCEVQVVVTGQHREMLDQVLTVFDIVPDHDLAIMKEGQTIEEITTRVLTGFGAVLTKEAPALVLVHGDTTTTFAAALAAFYRQIPVGHVEAGLRTWNMAQPYPEEANRQLTDVLAELYFAPTAQSRDNLLAEGKAAEKIFVTGNTAIDAMGFTVAKREHSEGQSGWLPAAAETDGSVVDWGVSFIGDQTENTGTADATSAAKLAADAAANASAAVNLTDAAGSGPKILVTMHRRENLGEPMAQVFRALRQVISEQPQAQLIFPMHKNPAVRQLAQAILGGLPQVELIEPLDVVAFQNLMADCQLVLTDSGGLQEEAPGLGVPVLVLRETTERPEGVAAGTVRLVGTDETTVYREVTRLLTNRKAYQEMAHAANPYGDGRASRRIVAAIAYHFGIENVRPADFQV